MNFKKKRCSGKKEASLRFPQCVVHTRRQQHCAYEVINKRKNNSIISDPIKLSFEYKDKKCFLRFERKQKSPQSNCIYEN